MSKRTETPLTIPPAPPIIAEAAARHREATAQREAAQDAHREAMRAYQLQKPGEPQAIKAAQVDALSDAIQPAIDTERAAGAALKQAQDAYLAETEMVLREPLKSFEGELASAFTQLDAVLAKGAKAAADARAAGISLPSAAPGVCKQVQAAIMPTLRNILRQGRVDGI